MIFRAKFPFAWALLAFAFAFAPPHAQAWQSCDLSQFWGTADLPDGNAFQFSQAFGIAANLDAVFAVGYSAPGTPASQQWTVRRSFDQGASWETAHRLSGIWRGSSAQAVATDHANGSVYVAGWAFDSSNNYHWIVQKSADDGFSWRTVDDFTVTGVQVLKASGVAVDRRGRIFVVGYSQSGINETWYVRRSDDGGDNWSTVDVFVGPLAAHANGVTVASGGETFVAGYTNNGSNFYVWTVRESTDHGNTWSTVDSVQGATDSDEALAITADHEGNVSVSGVFDEGHTGIRHWITRSADIDAPTVWGTVDDYTDSGLVYNAAQGNTYTLDGQLFVTGTSGNFGSVGNYVTRRAAAFSGPFYPSDFVSSEGSITGQGGNSATVDAFGNVYTAGNSVTPELGIHWMVRKLSCR